VNTDYMDLFAMPAIILSEWIFLLALVSELMTKITIIPLIARTMRQHPSIFL